MNIPAALRNHFYAPSQSYISNIIEGVKDIATAKAVVAIPVEATTFEYVSPNLVTRLSHKMDMMDKPKRFRAYLA